MHDISYGSELTAIGLSLKQNKNHACGQQFDIMAKLIMMANYPREQ